MLCCGFPSDSPEQYFRFYFNQTGGVKILSGLKSFSKVENELEEQRRPSLLDVVVLQDHVALQRESLIRVQADRSDLRRCLRNMEQKLQHEIQDRRDISSDLSRQYKTMQTELTHKVKRLEEEVSQLKEELALCQEELRKEKREREELEEEKDAAICDLQLKLDNMETDYEKILHETLDSLTSQLSVARQGWEDRSTSLHENYKQALSEFGLNALDV
ncbi:coiled-coil domain-containing protein 153 isoform X2 [Betta splendens]|uniref:Dynein regulatory complex protein 12 n=1 Tax=Betta splendens TaxID=158456 RepID=A0A9W2Y7W6_BETSP|nr:coiled-coil domain-containing protein 153 isoform X2 [Betta splendens]